MEQNTLKNSEEKKDKEVVYHYTTLDSLIGMMNNTTKENPFLTFWATHTDFMNDPEENIYGASLMMSVIRGIEEELSIPKNLRISELDEETLYRFHLSDKADFQSLTSEYSISFSLKKDYLPMWSMYAKKGVSLGFDRNKLDEYLIHTAEKRTYNIKYGNPKGNEWIEYLKKSYLENFNLLNDAVTKNSISLDKIPLFNYILLYQIVSRGIKHKAYEYENEVRIYYREKGHEVKFRKRSESMIPYIEILLPLDALAEIQLGPSYHSQESLLPIVKFFKNKMQDASNSILSNIEFDVSSIPYREK